MRISPKTKMALITASLLTLSGCVRLGPQETVKEIHYTRMKLGTPAVVVNEAGKPQVVRVQVVGTDGELHVGKVDANGMVLIDEPTFEYYRNLDKGKPGAGAPAKPQGDHASNDGRQRQGTGTPKW